MKSELRISAIRYANTFPFNYGLLKLNIDKIAKIEMDHPAECAKKLMNNEADIGLVPIAEIRNIKNARIISDYCIGTFSPVRTVLLVSNTPLNFISKIYLDYRSRTSIALAKILAIKKWKKDFEWIETHKKFDFSSLPSGSGLVIIGDQCFDLEDKFSIKIDLASEWMELNALPFVFACWVSNKEIRPEFLVKFNEALSFGITNIDKAIAKYKHETSMPATVLKNYLNNNIDYYLDDDKKKAMQCFFDYLDELNLV